MGRLFDTTSKTSTIPKSTSGKGRLFATPVKKATLGEKVDKVAKGVTKFVGGEKLSEAIGGTIAINKAEKRGDTKAVEYLGADLPTNKQTLASIGEVALNVVPLGVGLGAGAKVATKVATSIPRLAAEGAAYGTAQGGLRAVQEGADVFSKETATQAGIGGVIGGVAGAALGRLFKAKPTPVVVNEIVNKVDEVADNALSKSTTGIKKGTVKYLKENPQEIANREVKLREVDGKIVIEDGRHTLQAAKEQGITPKFVDVTSEYTGSPSSKISELISEPKVETPTVAQVAPEQQPIQQTPEYVASVEQRASKLSDDPEFKSSSDKSKIFTFDEKLANQPIKNQIDYVTGKDPSVIEGLPKTAALKLMREDVISNPGKYTASEIKRLTSNYASSQAGADLQATQVVRKAIIDNPFDAITLANRDLQTMLKKKGITKKNIISFLDDNQCTL